ncbi:MAG TPA: DUF6650 family protein [Jiangellaceae bacterium]
MRRKRLTGISGPWGGVQWENVKDEDKGCAKAVIAFLEDRRVLFGPEHMEDQGHCLQSCLEIRNFMTERLTTDEIGEDLASTLAMIRAACREFVEAAGPNARNFYGQRMPYETDPFSLALGDLRSRVGIYIDAIARRYRLGVGAELASIMPPEPAEGDDDLSWVPGFGH